MPGIRYRLLSIAVFIVFFLKGGESFASILDEANDAYRRGEMKTSLSLYKKALLEGENPAVCSFNIGNSYFQLDSLPQSIVHYTATISAAPDFFRGYLNLATAYYAMNDMGECIATILQALRIEPGNEKALMVLAAAYRKLKAYPEAITTFERLIELFPETGELYIALAEIYRDLRDREEAVRWLIRYPESGKNKSYAFLLLADMYEKTDDFGKALYYLERSFEGDPDNRLTFYRIVLLHEKAGNSLVALDAALHGLELFPEYADLALLAGNIAFEKERYYDADRFYTIARNLGNAAGIVGLENVRIMREGAR